jgi:hypothetical protein
MQQHLVNGDRIEGVEVKRKLVVSAPLSWHDAAQAAQVAFQQPAHALKIAVVDRAVRREARDERTPFVVSRRWQGVRRIHIHRSRSTWQQRRLEESRAVCKTFNHWNLHGMAWRDVRCNVSPYLTIAAPNHP